MLRSYPQAKPADPKGYILGLCAILAAYPQEVVDYVTAPLTGVQTRIKHHPVQAEIREACEDRMAFLYRLYEHQRRPKEIKARIAEREAETAARAARPSYADLIAKYGPSFGLKTLDAIDREQRRAASQRRAIQRQHAAIAAEWAAAGLDPPTIAGIPISTSLAETIRKQTGRTIAGNPKGTVNDDAA